MANIKSAKKRILVNRTKADRNKAIKSGVKTAVKKVNAAIEANDKAAAVEALKMLKYPCDVKFYSDSAYLVNGFNNKWIDNWIKNGWKTSTNKPVKNKELWEQLYNFTKIHNIEFLKVKGHNGDKYNEICDSLARKYYE